MKEEEADGAFLKKRGANKGNILGQTRKKEAEEKEAGGAVQKERGANKGNIFVQPRKKGRRMEIEKRRTQIENGDEQGDYFSASPKERQTNGERKAQHANKEQGRTKRTKKDY